MIPTLQLGGLGRRGPSGGGGGGGPVSQAVASLVERAASLTISSGSDTTVTMDAVIRDDGSMYSGGAPTVLTIPSTGWYLFTRNSAAQDAATGWYHNTYFSGSGLTAAREEREVSNGADSWRAAAGIAYATAANTVNARVNNYSGSNKTILANSVKLGAAKILAASVVGAHVDRTSTQSISNATQTAISFNSEIRDDGACYDAGSPTRLTVPTGEDGWYLITGNVSMASMTNGGLRVRIRLNGSDTLGYASTYNGASTMAQFAGAIHYLNAGDYIELTVEQDSGGSVNTVANNCKLAMVKVDAEAAAHVSKSTTQSIGASDTAISFDTETRDDGGMWTGAAPTRFTVPDGSDGWYVMAGWVHWASDTATDRRLKIRLDGSTVIQTSTQLTNNTKMPTPGQCVMQIYYLTGGQYVELVGYADTTNANAGAQFAIAHLPG